MAWMRSRVRIPYAPPLFMIVRNAHPSEAEPLSRLAFRSKAYWGYSEAEMTLFEKALQVEPAQCATGRVVVATDDDDTIRGFYTIAQDPPVGELSDLFVDTPYIGQGVGRLLLLRATSHAKRLGFTSIRIHSDPHAEYFYLKQGASRIGQVPSESIEGRFLPLLELPL